MSQIDELAPDLSVNEWVQGQPSNKSEQKEKKIVVKVFQVNCPGCLSIAFPDIINIYKKF